MSTLKQKPNETERASPGVSVVPKREDPSGGHPENPILRLQGAIGNRAVQRLLVSTPGDVHEREADTISERVIRRPGLQGSLWTDHVHSGVTGTSTAPANVSQVLEGPGRPLERGLRRDMEQRFGRDFSSVRVHTGSAAERSAQDMSAQAYTSGQNIVFGEGRFAPGTFEGRRLIAHELTHTIQQTDGGTSSSNVVLLQPLGSPSKSRSTPRSLGNSLDAERLSNESLAEEIELILQWQSTHSPNDPNFDFLSGELVGLQAVANARLVRELKEEKYRQDLARVVQAVEDGKPPKWMKIFPFLPTHGLGALMPWDWEFDSAPIMAEKEDGHIVVRQPWLAVGAEKRFKKDTRTLPGSVFTGGHKLRMNELVGVRLYDEGEKVVVVYAKDLLKFADASDAAVFKGIAITALSVAGGALAGKAVTGFWATRVSSPLLGRVLVSSGAGAIVGGTSSGLGTAIGDIPSLAHGSMSWGEYGRDIGVSTAYGTAYGAAFGGAGEVAKSGFTRALKGRGLPNPAEPAAPKRTPGRVAPRPRTPAPRTASAEVPAPAQADVSPGSRPNAGKGPGRLSKLGQRAVFLGKMMTGVDVAVPAARSGFGGGSSPRPVATAKMTPEVTTPAAAPELAPTPSVPHSAASAEAPAPAPVSAPRPSVNAPGTPAPIGNAPTASVPAVTPAPVSAVAPVATPAYTQGDFTIGVTPIGVHSESAAPATSQRRLHQDTPEQGTQLGTQTQIGPEIVTAINGVVVTSRHPDILLGADRARFRTDALAIILADANHPLGAAVDYAAGDWVPRPYAHGNMALWQQNPLDIQSGHGISDRLGGAEVIVWQSRFRNQMQSARLERHGAVSKDEYYNIGGIAVDPLSAWDLFDQGLLALPPTSFPKLKL